MLNELLKDSPFHMHKMTIKLKHKIFGLINNGQKIAANGIYEHISLYTKNVNSKEQSNESNEIVLITGPAGTGKTSMVKCVIEHAINNLNCLETPLAYILTAPTNQALKVLKKSTRDIYKKYLGRIYYFTVAQLINTRFVLDENTGKDKAVYGGPCKRMQVIQSERKCRFVIFIDETSMVKQDHIKCIRNQYNSLVVCMGDECQLPPVRNEEEAEASGADSDDIDSQSSIFNNISEYPTFALNRIVRQDNQELKQMISQFRTFVKEPESNIDINRFANFKDSFSKTTTSTFTKNVLETFSIARPKEARLITATNKKAAEYNKLIQDHLHPEVIKTNAPFGMKEGVLSQGYIVRYYNLEMKIGFYKNRKMIGEKVYGNDDWYGEIEYQKIKWTQALNRNEDEEASTIRKGVLAPTSTLGNVISAPQILYVNIEGLTKRAYKVWAFKVQFESLDYESDSDSDCESDYDSESMGPSLVTFIHDTDRTQFKKDLDNLRMDTIHKVNSMDPKEYGGNDAPMFKRAKLMEWGPFKMLESLCLNVPNSKLSLAYSTTVHKSQGSQYKCTFVDMNNIIYCRFNEEITIKCLYTAVSRCIDKCHALYTGTWDVKKLTHKEDMASSRRTITLVK